MSEENVGMAKFKVLATVTMRCEVYLDAESAASAAKIVEGMEPIDLLDHVIAEDVEVDAVGIRIRPNASDLGRQP